MLVLSRKARQTIQLDNGKIKIHVLRISGGRVRIGIEAPEEVHIVRGEINDQEGGEHGQRQTTPAA